MGPAPPPKASEQLRIHPAQTMKKKTPLALTLAAAFLAGPALALAAQDGHQEGAGHESHGKPEATPGTPNDAAVIAAQLPTYPLDTCPVSGKALPEEGAVDFVHQGRLVRLCCSDCEKGVPGKADEIFAKIDAGVIAQQKSRYPLKTCIVSGEALGSMGDPIDVVQGTRYLQLCCKGCKKTLAKKPEETLAALDAALIEALKPSYPLDTCLVSGEALGSMGEPVDKVYGVDLVRFCCKGCLKDFAKKPAGYLAELHKASAAAGERAKGL